MMMSYDVRQNCTIAQNGLYIDLNFKPSDTLNAEHPMDFLLTPGTIVRHPNQPDWGLGRIQAVDGDRIAVNFEEAGRQIIRPRHVVLEIVEAAVGYE